MKEKKKEKKKGKKEGEKRRGKKCVCVCVCVCVREISTGASRARAWRCVPQALIDLRPRVPPSVTRAGYVFQKRTVTLSATKGN